MQTLSLENRIRSVAAQVAPRLGFVVMGWILGSWAIRARDAAATKDWRSFYDRDWRLFYDTASLLLSGRVGALYPGVTPDLPFVYPPFFAWQVLPLGLAPRSAAYGCLLVAMLLATAAALWSLREALDPQRRPVEVWIWFVLSSAGWTWMVVAGHISAWYLMLASLGLLLWTRDRPIAAGLVLSLMLSKPHYALVVLCAIALARGWRVLVGALSGAAVLAASTIPLGWATWKAWASQAAAAPALVHAVPAWKQITLRASWLSLFEPARAQWATALWLLTAGSAATLAGWAAWRAGTDASRRGRIIGLGVLVALACGPYAFHYDGLLLAIPGLAWYLQRETYLTSRSHMWCGVFVWLAYVVQHLNGWVLQRNPSLTGFLLTGWLVAEALDLLRAELPPRERDALNRPSVLAD